MFTHSNSSESADDSSASMHSEVFNLLILFTLVWLFVFLSTLALALNFSLKTAKTKAENTMKTIVTSLADSAMVKDAIQSGNCPPSLAAYLNDIIKISDDIQVITIADKNSTRIFHLVPSRIGGQFVGGDEGRVLQGESYFSDAQGTLGFQHRYFSPVKDGNGAITGFVMASMTTDGQEQLRERILRSFAVLAALLLAFTIFLATLMLTFTKRILHGLDPDTLVQSYLQQTEILRANNHEFMNKLQVISGLIQMGQTQEALSYIGSVAETQTRAISPILQNIVSPTVAALILGKLANATEMDIRLVLLNGSSLPRHSAYLSTTELVTLIGNLLENAIEAVNIKPLDELRNIDLQITEDDKSLLIMVSDSGIGIPENKLAKIYENGFSTKGTKGRGIGMTKIKDIVDKHNGDIEIESEEGTGTTFTVIIRQKRETLGAAK